RQSDCRGQPQFLADGKLVLARLADQSVDVDWFEVLPLHVDDGAVGKLIAARDFLRCGDQVDLHDVMSGAGRIRTFGCGCLLLERGELDGGTRIRCGAASRDRRGDPAVAKAWMTDLDDVAGILSQSAGTDDRRQQVALAGAEFVRGRFLDGADDGHLMDLLLFHGDRDLRRAVQVPLDAQAGDHRLGGFQFEPVDGDVPQFGQIDLAIVVDADASRRVTFGGKARGEAQFQYVAAGDYVGLGGGAGKFGQLNRFDVLGRPGAVVVRLRFGGVAPGGTPAQQPDGQQYAAARQTARPPTAGSGPGRGSHERGSTGTE